ncbi:MAG: YbjN domain-containing protein [Gemmataceae bacterium]
MPVRLCLLCLTLAVAAAPAQDIVRSLTPDQAETILKARKSGYHKAPADAKGNVIFDYKKDGISLAFYIFAGGKDIMVDAVLPPIPVEAVNQWNTPAKFSRACLRRDGAQFITVLEFNLDLQGGVTLETVSRFIDNFENEVKSFNDFLARSVKDEPVIDQISDAQMEKTLSRLGLKFSKRDSRDAVTFDFQLQGHKVKLASVKGKELFLDAIFPPLPLEQANRYNLQKKFIRVVNLSAEGEPYTTLQAALDLSGGVTETMIANFITSFEVEIEQFAAFRKKTVKD